MLMINRTNKTAQLSLYDALLFFLIIVIASTVIFIASLTPTSIPETINVGENIRVADNTLNSILVSTINETSYIDNSDGSRIGIYDASVSEAIHHYLKLKTSGGDYDLTNLSNSIGVNIELASLEHYYYAFHVVYEKDPGSTLFYSNAVDKFEDLPEERVASSQVLMIEEKMDATITYFVWNK